VAIVGDRRKFISALIVPDFKQLEKWADHNKVKYSSREKLIDDPRVIRLYSKEIERYTTSCSRVEKVKRFTLLTGEWTQSTGELTPSQKVKRHIIEEKYRKHIDHMYREGEVQ